MSWTASDFERLDPRLLRSFLAVVKTESFSDAARVASLTQGAISQQIAKLEDRLNTQLFLRAGNKVVLTAAGQMLAAYAESYMDHTTRFLEQLNEEFESLRGLVRYAMPESCIHAPHFGWLLDKRKEFPGIVLKIELKPTADVQRDLLDGEIDFGFVNQDCRLATVLRYPFCKEEYVLVQAGKALPVVFPSNLDELLALPMVVYPGMIDCLNHWISAQYAETDPITSLALRVSGEFNDMRGALAMVSGDLGLSVMPRHVAAGHIEAGSLRCIEPGDIGTTARTALQQISIIRLKDRRMPARVKRVIRWFLEMHTELQPVPEEFLQ